MNQNGYRRRLDVLEERVPKSAPVSSPDRPSRIANDPTARQWLIDMHEAEAQRRFEDAARLKFAIALRLREMDLSVPHSPERISQIVNDPEAHTLWSAMGQAWAGHRVEAEARLKRELARRIHELVQQEE